MGDLGHLDEDGSARMVDVGAKPVTEREASAEGFVMMGDATTDALFDGSLPKGDAIAVARVAAIQGAKRTADLIPLCHPIPISGVEVGFERAPAGVRIVATVRTAARTGVEMEALTAVSVGALTIYDMAKGLDRGAEIGQIRLVSKSGGASGTWER